MARARQNRMTVARRGLMLVLSSPSGAGKTTLSRMLLKADGHIELSVSVTTRPQRPGEVDGRDYHFIDMVRFESMVKSDKLLEWAEVFGHRYGTPRLPVEKALRAGRDVLFDIDWQGTQQLREKARDDLVSVFILPPTVKELQRRLERRAQDSRAIIAGRMAKAAGEMSHWPEYDYVIVNRDKDDAFAEVRSILAAERLKRERQIGLVRFRARSASEIVEADHDRVGAAKPRSQRNPADRRIARSADFKSASLSVARWSVRWTAWTPNRSGSRRRSLPTASGSKCQISVRSFRRRWLGATIGAATFGPLADRLGRKRLLVFATVLFGVFTILTALANSVPMLLRPTIVGGHWARRSDAVLYRADVGICAGAAAR